MEIKKDKRSLGVYFQKAPLIKGITKCKKQALKDIVKECGMGKFYSRNYLPIEYLVLIGCSCEMHILNINTNLL